MSEYDDTDYEVTDFRPRDDREERRPRPSHDRDDDDRRPRPSRDREDDRDDVDDEHDDDVEDDDDDRRERRPSRSSRRTTALRRARQELSHLRREVAELKAGRRPGDSDGETAEDIAKRVRAEVAAEYEERQNALLVKTEAADALREAGYRGSPRRGVRQLDLEDVIVTNGEVDAEALADAIADLKEDSPELFRRSRRASEDDEELDSDGGRPRGRARPRDAGGPRQRSGNGRAEDPMVAGFRAISGGRR